MAHPQQAASPAGQLLVVNQHEHALLLVDPAARRTVASVSVAVNPHEVALSPDAHRAFVPIYSDTVLGAPGSDGRTVAVVDLASRTATAIDLGRPLRPHSAVFGPDGLLYVTTELSQSIPVVDTHTGAVVGEIPTGRPQSHMLALSSDGRRGYTANVDSGTVSVLDIPGRRLVTVIPVAKTIQRIAVSPDGRRAFTSDRDTPRVAVIDTRTNTVQGWIPTGATPFATRPTPDGRWLLIAEQTGHGAGRIEAVDLASMKVVHRFDLTGWPSFLLIHDDLVYMSCLSSGAIEVLNWHTWTMQPPIATSPGIDGMAWVPHSAGTPAKTR